MYENESIIISTISLEGFSKGETILSETKDEHVNSNVIDTKAASDESERTRRSSQILRSIVAMGVVFMLLYTSYSGLFSLSSSLHIQEGMGTICASVRYTSLVISSLFFPKLLITYIGHKWTVCVSLVGFIIWMAANGYAVWATMIPASIINGVFVASLWAAQGAYYTLMGQEYAALNGLDTENVVAWFFGMFYMFYLASGIFGNLISTTVLRTSPPENYTAPSQEFIDDNCGINDCPWQTLNNTNLDPVPSDTVWLLCGIYIAIALVALVLGIVLVDQIPSRDDTKKVAKENVCHEIRNSFINTMALVRHKQLLLLIPMTFYVGLEETYFYSDFNRSWVTCSIGIWMIGIVNIPFAVTGTGASMILGKVVKYTNRFAPVIFAFLIDVVIHLTLVFWTIDPDVTYPFYLISTLWGLSDAIWITLTTILYGVSFPDDSDAAFSQYMLWQCAGYAFAYGYSYFVCSSVKLMVLHVFLWLGTACYFIWEKVHHEKQRTSLSITKLV